MKLTRSKGTIVLVYKPAFDGYVVKSATNTLRKKIGENLTAAEVQTLIDEAFTVRILC